MGKLGLLACVALVPCCHGQILSQGERDYALSALHASRKLFLDSLSGLSEAQIRWKPAPDVWSVMQVAEHIVESEEFLSQMAAKAMQSAPEPSKKQPNVRALDAKILQQTADRSQKAKAPEQLVPTGKYKTVEAIQAAFKTRRDRSIAYVRETQDDLRSHFAPYPAGEMDGLQWYLMMAGHTERHVLQIREVMAMAGFPKK